MRTIFLLLLSATTASIQAQNLLPEVNPAPNPFDKIKRSFYPVPEKPVKCIMYINAGDTTSISFFDAEGYKNLEIGYSKNRPVNKLVCKKSDSGFETLFYGNFQQELQATQKYKYNKKRNLTEWERIGYGAIHWYFEYDSQNRLSREYTIGEIVNDQKARLQEYRYDTAGRLTEIVREQWIKNFTYDGDRLVAQEEHYINGSINTLNSFSRYSYDTAGRITLIVSNRDSTLYFHEGSQLKSMISYKNDDTYEAVDFFYEKGLLQKAMIRTTTIYTEALFIPPVLFSLPGKGKASEREMHFFYDARNNIKEIKYFAEGDYKCSRAFVSQYY